MTNYKFQLKITSEEILNKLPMSQRRYVEEIQITRVDLQHDQSIIIECLALNNSTIQIPHIQVLSDGYPINLDPYIKEVQ